MPFLKRNAAALTLALAIFDSLCILLAYCAAVYALVGADPAVFIVSFREHLSYFVMYVLVWCVFAVDQRLFMSHREDTLRSQLIAVLKTAVIALVFSVLLVLWFTQHMERVFIAYYGAATLVSLVCFRLMMRLALWSLRTKGFNYRQILVVGCNERSRHLLDIILHRARYGFHVAGILDDDPERMKLFEGMQVTYAGNFQKLEELLVSKVIDEVYITLPVRSHYETIQSMAYLCEGIGVPVRMIADLFPLRIATSTVRHFEDVPVLSLSAVPEAQAQLTVKRFIDLAVSSTLLVAGSPVFLMIALLIKLESPGPVFFLQERVGLNQRRFKMIKFRSMVVNAEARQKELEAMNEADGPVFKIRNDPRITRIGGFIRKYSIDEFPQLINVWRGQMSLVGPRPPIPAEVEKYSWDQRRRLSVKPGMTGLWQISGRSDVSFKEWVELDLQYIDSWSNFEDFRILMRTFQAVIKGRGAA
ncbi:MAG: sugar transferase [Candidatus Hydrogenedentes bacterium]|nr:sugar transferase [Candidatus Hydrogenedentota bacterium]